MALWTPSDTTTALWLDFADASKLFDATAGGSLVAADGSIARAEDKSGNARHYTQSGSTSRPIRKTAIQNGRDISRFDGSNDWLESTYVAWGTSYAVVIVARTTTNAANQGIFVSRSNSLALPINPQIGVNAASQSSSMGVRDDAGVLNASVILGLQNDAWYLFSGTRNGNAVTAFRDGTAGASVSNSLGTITPNRTTVGSIYTGAATPGSYLSGDVGEVIVCGLSDRQKIEGYLAWKWGLQGSLPNDHPYKNGPPIKGGNAAAVYFFQGW